MVKDTYGNELGESSSQQPEYVAFQKRNEAIRSSAIKTRNKYPSVSSNSISVSRVHFFSDGVKLAGSLWIPKNGINKTPGILLAHGWGGLKDHLDVRYAPYFAEEGFVVLTFDYRGWGDSDGAIILLQDHDRLQERGREQDFKRQQQQQQVQASTNEKNEIRVVRQTVDMTWQLSDIDAALSYLCGIRNIGKIGIWGTSQAGGHVIEIAGRDYDRIHCVVSQVPSMGRWGAGSVTSQNIHQRSLIQAIEASRAPVPWFPLPREFHFPAMDGGPILRRLFFYDPLLRAQDIVAPLLVIDSENEELWDRNKNGKRAYDIVQQRLGSHKCEYYLLRGADHYDAYGKRADEARSKAIAFFKKHLLSGNNNNEEQIRKRAVL
jgi:dienelactone hydrolase